MVSIDILSQIGLFMGLPQHQLDAIADLCEEITFQAEEMPFREGEKADCLYILMEGKVNIQVGLTSRPQQITVAVISQVGQAFGWSSLVTPHRYTASAICKEPSHLIALNGQELMRILEQNPEAGFLVIRRISELVSNRLRYTRIALLKSL